YVRSLGIDKQMVFPVPYTTDMSLFLKIPLLRAPEAARRLLFVGQIIERKGLDLFLASLNRWGEKHRTDRMELWVLGDGPARSKLQATPMVPNVAVTWFGNARYSDVPHFYSAAGILVFPTLADEWGLVVNEALGAGLPVLGSVYSQAVDQLI